MDRVALIHRLAPSLFTLRGSPSTTPELDLGGKEADELLAKAVARGRVGLEMTITAFEQRRGTMNRNYTRFAEDALPALAASGAGMPYLRDHNQDDALSRGGTIVASTGVGQPEAFAIKQRVAVTEPSAVERVLRGNVSTFSIGWSPTGDVVCSLCNAPVFSSCYHWPGMRARQVDEDGVKRYVRDNAGPIRAEWVYTAAELVETSEVSVPAVPGVGLDEVRALAAAFKVPDEHLPWSRAFVTPERAKPAPRPPAPTPPRERTPEVIAAEHRANNPTAPLPDEWHKANNERRAREQRESDERMRARLAARPQMTDEEMWKRLGVKR